MILSGNRVLTPGTDIRFPQSAFNLRGMGDPNSGDSWYDQLPVWLRDIQAAINTQKLLDLNIQRAQQGLPPISSNAVAPTVNFGLSPQTMQMLFVGLGILGVAYLLKKR